MSETLYQIAFVVGIAVIAVFSVSRMKSPSKGGDAMSGVLAELQKTIEPQVKHATQTERKKKVEGEKTDDDSVT